MLSITLFYGQDFPAVCTYQKRYLDLAFETQNFFSSSLGAAITDFIKLRKVQAAVTLRNLRWKKGNRNTTTNWLR
jgi:hypothetical protein